MKELIKKDKEDFVPLNQGPANSWAMMDFHSDNCSSLDSIFLDLQIFTFSDRQAREGVGGWADGWINGRADGWIDRSSMNEWID